MKRLQLGVVHLVILALGSLRQEDDKVHTKFHASLDYIKQLCLKKPNQTKIPAINYQQRCRELGTFSQSGKTEQWLYSLKQH
jgi:hypothetical protein